MHWNIFLTRNFLRSLTDKDGKQWKCLEHIMYVYKRHNRMSFFWISLYANNAPGKIVSPFTVHWVCFILQFSCRFPRLTITCRHKETEHTSLGHGQYIPCIFLSDGDESALFWHYWVRISSPHWINPRVNRVHISKSE